MVGSVCAFDCYTCTLNLLFKHTRLVSICAFDSYTFTLNLLCKHTRLVNVGMFEGYVYTLNFYVCAFISLCICLCVLFSCFFFSCFMYCNVLPCLAFLVRMCVAAWQC